MRNLVAIVALLLGSEALARTEASEKAWSFYASGYAYFVPEDDDYLQPTVTADRDRLHLEARYNYEGIDAASIWAGCNFRTGGKVTLEATLMAGGVFGDTEGVAPGYKVTLSWSKLTFYSEGEYVFDTNESTDSFFYAWSEVSWAPVEWFRFGLAGQRTKAYDSDRDVQGGVLAGFSAGRVDITAYVFDLDASSPITVVAIGVSF
jgi:hypothetical protein